MADDRPRPRYGEYATPQDQAEAIAVSLPPVSPLLTPGTSATPAPATPTQRAPRRVRTAPARRRWDSMLSVGLLAYGLLSVISGAVQYSDVAALVDRLYELQGIGTFTPTELARPIGVAIIVVNLVLYVITAFLTVRLLRAHKLAFYVPLAGGALATIISAALLFAVIFGDPAFTSYISNAG